MFQFDISAFRNRMPFQRNYNKLVTRMISFHFIVQIKLWTYVCNIYSHQFFFLLPSFSLFFSTPFHFAFDIRLVSHTYFYFFSRKTFGCCCHCHQCSRVRSSQFSLLLYLLASFLLDMCMYVLSILYVIFHTFSILIGIFQFCFFRLISISFSLLPSFAPGAHLNLFDIFGCQLLVLPCNVFQMCILFSIFVSLLFTLVNRISGYFWSFLCLLFGKFSDISLENTFRVKKKNRFGFIFNRKTST